ncbi:MAG: carotenoid 1,2-hydratase [Rubrivivax sp.]|nr:carotenoid 1,2-hydratase [Rubrivivax sp.]
MDAISDDGRHALTVIAFVGSVFSPYYAHALRRNPAADPLNHCALNVCLYSLDGQGPSRWTMTERGSRHVQREARRFVIGPSSLSWQDDELTLDLCERGMPLPQRVLGRLRVQVPALARYAVALDAPGQHRWVPIAPVARIEVDLAEPALRWRGKAYLDSNEGDTPVTEAFNRWDWLRATAPDGRTTVIYDTEPVQGAARVVARQFAPDGSSLALPVPPRQALPSTRWWRIQRHVRAVTSAGGQGPAVARTLEDTPFYARSVLQLPVCDEHAGQTVAPEQPGFEVIHESLDAGRLRSGLVQALLPFRMPRRG